MAQELQEEELGRICDLALAEIFIDALGIEAEETPLTVVDSWEPMDSESNNERAPQYEDDHHEDDPDQLHENEMEFLKEALQEQSFHDPYDESPLNEDLASSGLGNQSKYNSKEQRHSEPKSRKVSKGFGLGAASRNDRSNQGGSAKKTFKGSPSRLKPPPVKLIKNYRIAPTKLRKLPPAPPLDKILHKAPWKPKKLSHHRHRTYIAAKKEQEKISRTLLKTSPLKETRGPSMLSRSPRASGGFSGHPGYGGGYLNRSQADHPDFKDEPEKIDNGFHSVLELSPEHHQEAAARAEKHLLEWELKMAADKQEDQEKRGLAAERVGLHIDQQSSLEAIDKGFKEERMDEMRKRLLPTPSSQQQQRSLLLAEALVNMGLPEPGAVFAPAPQSQVDASRIMSCEGMPLLVDPDGRRLQTPPEDVSEQQLIAEIKELNDMEDARKAVSQEKLLLGPAAGIMARVDQQADNRMKVAEEVARRIREAVAAVEASALEVYNRDDEFAMFRKYQLEASKSDAKAEQSASLAVLAAANQAYKLNDDLKNLGGKHGDHSSESPAQLLGQGLSAPLLSHIARSHQLLGPLSPASDIRATEEGTPASGLKDMIGATTANRSDLPGEQPSEPSGLVAAMGRLYPIFSDNVVPRPSSTESRVNAKQPPYVPGPGLEESSAPLTAVDKAAAAAMAVAAVAVAPTPPGAVDFNLHTQALLAKRDEQQQHVDALESQIRNSFYSTKEAGDNACSESIVPGQDSSSFFELRMQRSKNISAQLTKLQEESRKLQEQSNNLQHRAIEMQRQAGLPITPVAIFPGENGKTDPSHGGNGKTDPSHGHIEEQPNTEQDNPDVAAVVQPSSHTAHTPPILVGPSNVVAKEENKPNSAAGSIMWSKPTSGKQPQPLVPSISRNNRGRGGSAQVSKESRSSPSVPARSFSGKALPAPLQSGLPRQIGGDGTRGGVGTALEPVLPTWSDLVSSPLMSPIKSVRVPQPQLQEPQAKGQSRENQGGSPGAVEPGPVPPKKKFLPAMRFDFSKHQPPPPQPPVQEQQQQQPIVQQPLGGIMLGPMIPPGNFMMMPHGAMMPMMAPGNMGPIFLPGSLPPPYDVSMAGQDVASKGKNGPSSVQQQMMQHQHQQMMFLQQQQQQMLQMYGQQQPPYGVGLPFNNAQFMQPPVDGSIPLQSFGLGAYPQQAWGHALPWGMEPSQVQYGDYAASLSDAMVQRAGAIEKQRSEHIRDVEDSVLERIGKQVKHPDKKVQSKLNVGSGKKDKGAKGVEEEPKPFRLF